MTAGNPTCIGRIVGAPDGVVCDVEFGGPVSTRLAGNLYAWRAMMNWARKNSFLGKTKLYILEIF